MKTPRSTLAIIIALTIGIAAVNPAIAISPSQDTDGDSLPDIEEDQNGNGALDTGETDPYNVDTDGGGESDGTERRSQRNALDPTDDLTYDADSDGVVTGLELLRNTDPKKADTDADGVSDKDDIFPLDPRYHRDANTNGLPDEWETTTGLDRVTVPQSRVDDPDADGLKNAEELAKGTHPLREDSDFDGTDDAEEVEQGTSPSENACLEYAAVSEDMSDIMDHWAKRAVMTLAGTTILPDQTPIIRGYTEGSSVSFKPNKDVTRYEFLKMVLLSTCTRLRTYTDRDPVEFTDVRKTAVINENPDFTFRRYIIYTAAHEKIVQGYSDGSFQPDAAVTRAEAVKILSLAARLQEFPSGSGTTLPFSDVPEESWFAPFVRAASSGEIVRGYGDGTFRPERKITRAEAAVIIERTIRRNPYINGYILPEVSEE